MTRAIRSCKAARLSARLVALRRVSLGPAGVATAVVATAVVATDAMDAMEGVVIMDATDAVSTDGVETAEWRAAAAWLQAWRAGEGATHGEHWAG